MLSVYTTVGWYAVAIGVAVMAVSPLVKKLMHLDTLKDDDDHLAGQAELAEPAAPGMHPENETAPNKPE